MRAVNLLPKDAPRGRAVKPLSPVALIAVLGVALLLTALAVAYVRADGAAEEKRAELERLRVQLAVTPRPRRAAPPASPKLAKERANRASALASAFSGRVSWDRLLRRFSLVLPDDVWLTSLSGTAPASTDGTAGTPPPASPGGTPSTPAATGAPTGFVVQGRAYSHEGVARLISRLETLPDLKNVQLQRSELTELAGAEVVDFTVAAEVRPGGEPS